MRISITLALAGCVGSHDAPDAAIDGPVDAAPDAPADTLACTPRAGSDLVTVDGPSGSAMLAVTFVVHDPTGAVVSKSSAMASDATIQLAVPSCGMVSVFEDDPSNTRHPRQLLTWTGVQPGDHLVHIRRAPAELAHAVTVQLAALAGATSYQLATGCQTGASITFNATPGAQDMSTTCRAGVTGFSAVATATTPTGTSIAFAPDLTFATGTTNVTLPAYQPATAIAISASGMTKFVNGRALVATYATPAPDRAVQVGFDVETLGQPAMAFAPLPVAPGSGIVELFVASDTMLTTSTRVLRGVASIPTAIAIDASEMLPIPSGTVDIATTRPTVTWSAGAPIDANVLAIGVTVGAVEWTLFGPARPGAARFPDEPSDILAAAAPALTNLVVFDASDLASYDSVRGQERDLADLVHPPGPGAQLRNSSWHE